MFVVNETCGRVFSCMNSWLYLPAYTWLYSWILDLMLIHLKHMHRHNTVDALLVMRMEGKGRCLMVSVVLFHLSLFVENHNQLTQYYALYYRPISIWFECSSIVIRVVRNIIRYTSLRTWSRSRLRHHRLVTQTVDHLFTMM